VRSIDELMDLQRRLAGVQLQRTMEFWGSMWRTASENQMSVISQLQSATARAAEDATRFSTAQQQSNAVSVREASAAIKEAAQQQERQHQQQHRRAG
ncbi:MAG TPA: hypothetical protein VM140_07755, partial [Burkholderiales bacterium]|nr:hypothetical protein [Burkholderiales bacterium]